MYWRSMAFSVLYENSSAREQGAVIGALDDAQRERRRDLARGARPIDGTIGVGLRREDRESRRTPRALSDRRIEIGAEPLDDLSHFGTRVGALVLRRREVGADYALHFAHALRERCEVRL